MYLQNVLIFNFIVTLCFFFFRYYVNGFYAIMINCERLRDSACEFFFKLFFLVEVFARC